MVRHSAIIGHGNRPVGNQPIRFDGDGWQRYVPIRLPQTKCLEDHVPTGAAAVLLNQSHTYPDLVLPIDEEQKEMYNAIDGKCTLAQIADGIPAMGDRRALQARTRDFFKVLWWYDQVVFDASQ